MVTVHVHGADRCLELILVLALHFVYRTTALHLQVVELLFPKLQLLLVEMNLILELTILRHTHHGVLVDVTGKLHHPLLEVLGWCDLIGFGSDGLDGRLLMQGCLARVGRFRLVMRDEVVLLFQSRLSLVLLLHTLLLLLHTLLLLLNTLLLLLLLMLLLHTVLLLLL